jgi:hypothetical protein
MHAPALIRTHHDIETPAPGTWAIAHGWTVGSTWRAGLRLRRADARTLSGTLIVGSEPGSLGLLLTVDTSAVEAIPADALLLRTTMVVAAADGRWGVEAAVDPVVHGQVGPVWDVVRAELRYHGVFRIGDGARARIALRARIAVPAGPTGVASRRRAAVVDLVADLDAAAPAGLVTAACAEPGPAFR